MNRSIRRFAALFAIGALAFSQLAVSAFACPKLAEAAVAVTAAGEEHCDRPDTPNLCDQHCEYGAANVNHAAPDAAPDVLALVLPWRAEPRTSALIAASPLASHLPPAHPPPPRLLFGILRI